MTIAYIITLKGQSYDMISEKCVWKKMDLIKVVVDSVVDMAMINSTSQGHFLDF